MILYGLLAVLVGAWGLRSLGTPVSLAREGVMNRADHLFIWMILAGWCAALFGLLVWLWTATS